MSKPLLTASQVKFVYKVIFEIMVESTTHKYWSPGCFQHWSTSGKQGSTIEKCKQVAVAVFFEKHARSSSELHLFSLQAPKGRFRHVKDEGWQKRSSQHLQGQPSPPSPRKGSSQPPCPQISCFWARPTCKQQILVPYIWTSLTLIAHTLSLSIQNNGINID